MGRVYSTSLKAARIVKAVEAGLSRLSPEVSDGAATTTGLVEGRVPSQPRFLRSPFSR